jgi:cephalosporin-C deacetylase
MVVAPDKSNGVYQDGDTVHWTVEWKGGTDVPAAHYTLKSGGQTDVGQGSLIFSNDVATLDSKFDKPDTMLVEVQWQPENETNRAVGGAVAAPDKILPAAPPPDDFDAFWKAKLKELKKAPAHPKLEKVDSGRPGVAYWKITLDNIGGTHIQGQIARPEKGEKFPALLIPQWAGVYGLQKSWVTDRAAEGWLALDVEPHDLPIDNPEAFYKDPNQVHEASRYYDTANFARHIKCTVLVGLGLRDEVCPPSSVFALENQITSPKEVIILPKSGHQNEYGSQAAYDQRRWGAWLPALRQGKPAPVNQ